MCLMDMDDPAKANRSEIEHNFLFCIPNSYHPLYLKNIFLRHLFKYYIAQHILPYKFIAKKNKKKTTTKNIQQVQMSLHR